jgi:2-succinyl-5-enolpyruvyl-6-hydroxy-3-cyclohexene-1-carboxylate synthase
VTKASSQSFAAELLATLVAAGAKHLYLAPGARSQSLAIAADQLAQANLADLTIRLDERSMGFVALGRAMATGVPAVVITTSGTAVANLHPAVLEAHHSGVPMLLLTADRPARLRGKGANQTTNQVGIFADAVIRCIDVSVPELGEFDPRALAIEAIELATGENPGPVQLNLQFQEPLSALSPNASELKVAEVSINPARSETSSLEVVVSDRAVVVAGAGAGQAAVDFAKAANLPLFAEPTSGARYSKQLVVDYIAGLNGDLGSQVDQVFVFGKPTLSRPVQRLIANSKTWVCASKTHGHFDPSGKALGYADELIPLGLGEQSWLEKWQKEEAFVSPRSALATAIWEATGTNEQLLFGASQIIREADRALPAKEISAFANRGLAGIDGTVSTAVGLAQNGKKTRVLLGDLTLLHDASGLNLSGIENLDIQLIVGNDHGGEIFKKLEVAQMLPQDALERLFLTPQQVDFKALAHAYGWEYFAVDSIADLNQVMQRSGQLLIDYKL